MLCNQENSTFASASLDEIMPMNGILGVVGNEIVRKELKLNELSFKRIPSQLVTFSLSLRLVALEDVGLDSNDGLIRPLTF